MSAKKRQTKGGHQTGRSRLDILWWMLGIIAFLGICLAFTIVFERWLLAFLTGILILFLLWICKAGYLFTTWTYRIRRAYDAYRDANWEKLDDDLKQLQSFADKFPANDVRRAMILFHMGDIQRVRGYYKDGLKYLSESKQILSKLKKPRINDLLAATNNLGVCYYDLGDYDRARDYYEEALNICDESAPKNFTIKSVCWHNLARIHLDFGEWQKAEKYLQRIDDSISNFKGQIALECLMNTSWAELELHTGDVRQAEEMAWEALDLADSAKGDVRQIKLAGLKMVSQICLRKGDAEEALEYLEEAGELLEHMFDAPQQSNVQYHLMAGQIAMAMNNDQKAEREFRQALAISEKIDFPDTFETGKQLHDFGLLLKKLGKHDEAASIEERSQRALACAGLEEIGSIMPVSEHRIKEADQ